MKYGIESQNIKEALHVKIGDIGLFGIFGKETDQCYGIYNSEKQANDRLNDYLESIIDLPKMLFSGGREVTPMAEIVKSNYYDAGPDEFLCKIHGAVSCETLDRICLWAFDELVYDENNE